MTSSTFETVNSIMAPVDASKLSGRYQTEVKVNGENVQVLRSIRHAPRNLVLRGSLTPQKTKPFSSADMDDLCGLFNTKANVTPPTKKKTPCTRSAKKKAGKDVDSVKENLGKALQMIQKSSDKKSTRFSEDTKKVAVAPARRSRRSRN
mmetsp:Transcript_24718/g.59590  ORF Transcript_24718/g.59590 Transcript_24718/m.59590 type:complete len:149 (+) Transcript_24718:68-514(+)